MPEAARRVPLGLAVAINFLGPLAIATFRVRKPALLLWPVLALACVLLLARQDGMWVATPAALVFPVGSALGRAAYILLMKRVGTLFDGLQGLATSLIVAALVTASFGILMSAEPAIATAIGFVVLSQPQSGLQIAGTFCVVAASIGAVVQK